MDEYALRSIPTWAIAASRFSFLFGYLSSFPFYSLPAFNVTITFIFPNSSPLPLCLLYSSSEPHRIFFFLARSLTHSLPPPFALLPPPWIAKPAGKCPAMHHDQLAELQFIASRKPAPTEEELALVLDPKALTIDKAVLGAGSFAIVRAGKYKFPVHGETEVAVKIFRGTEAFAAKACSDDGPTPLSKLEASALSELKLSEQVSRNNPFLVQTYGGVRVADDGVCLVMERMAGHSLRAVLDADEAVPLTWNLRARWLMEVAAGMKSMHNHRPTPIVRPMTHR